MLSCVGCVRTAVLPASGSITTVEIKLRTEALLINGGSSRSHNYHSHLVHIRRLTELLLDSGVSRENISIFASDGQDKDADLALREPGIFDSYWLVENTKIGEMLGPPVRYVDSTVEGMRLLPAKKAAIETWFQLKASKLKKGDTLLVYVTDHGESGDKNTKEASISLWGEKLTVSELITMLDSLDPEVQVVLWMSQCYSAGFDRAVYAVGDVLRRRACGFYSTREDLPAWGCYPEALSDDEGKGHSMRFLDELEKGGTFSEAHGRVMVSDLTPDVPNRSSDHYLAKLIEQEARKQQVTVEELANSLLEAAWKNDSEFAEQIRIIGLLASRVGIVPPKSLEDLDNEIKKLEEHLQQSAVIEERWEDIAAGIKKHRMARFTAQEKEWRAKKLSDLLKTHNIKGSPDGDEEEFRLALLIELTSAFSDYLNRYPEALKRLNYFHEKQQMAANISRRMKAREGAIFRLRTILLSIAGEILTRKNPDLQAGLDRLRRCEAWGLPGGSPKKPNRLGTVTSANFPMLIEDIAKIEELRPAWLGVHYIPEHAEVRQEFDLGRGAIIVSNVVKGSSAHSAGVRRGDTIFGAGDNIFKDTEGLKEHVMTSQIGQSLALKVLRDGKRMTIAVPLQQYPEVVPKPPPGPREGQLAPSLAGLKAYAGSIPGEKSPMLLAFFTTWCGPCKRAMGKLVEWEKEHSIPVILVSAEDKEAMSKWVTRWKKPRPSRIALDLRGLVMDAYRAKSFPTFILLDGDGRIQKIQRGFGKGSRLPVP